jgi:hypothetical protein
MLGRSEVDRPSAEILISFNGPKFDTELYAVGEGHGVRVCVTVDPRTRLVMTVVPPREARTAAVTLKHQSKQTLCGMMTIAQRLGSFISQR